MNESRPRIGYAPYSPNLTHPGDLRRFVAYARARNLPFEIARPNERYDILVLSEFSDISVWSEYRTGKIVYDLIDSYLAVPRTDIKQLLRGLAKYAKGQHRRLRIDFKGAIQHMCRRADAVVCTTDEQKDYIEPFCQNAHVILDIHDYAVQSRKHDYGAHDPFNLVWEGLPSNLPQLKAIRSVLREISKRRPLALHIITDPDRPRSISFLPKIESSEITRAIFNDVILHRWDASTFSDIVTKCDAAIIPIFVNDPLFGGKPGNKLALLWRMAMPVVTSATPAYRRMQEAAGLGYLACDNNADWFAALDRLMADETARRESGERGYAFVSANLQSTRSLALWDDVFASIGFDFRER